MASAEPIHIAPVLTPAEAMRRAMGAAIADGFFYAAAMGFGALPVARPSLHGLEVHRDVAYREGGHPLHKLDVWKPKGATGPLPVVIYAHGGGFRFMSKDTHWIFALIFARRGYVVFNLDYRLAPGNPFPAAVEDACDAYRFVVENAHRWGGDPTRIVLAGESAGANLSTAVALATLSPRPEPFARKVFDTGVVPRAVVPACGMLQVSHPERFGRKTGFMHDRIAEVPDAYLAGVRLEHPSELELADPVVAFEQAKGFERTPPPFLVVCGTWDPVFDDSKRLAAALGRHGGVVEGKWYPRGPHAFHGFVFTPSALKCWRDTFDFLGAHVPGASAP